MRWSSGDAGERVKCVRQEIELLAAVFVLLAEFIACISLSILKLSSQRVTHFFPPYETLIAPVPRANIFIVNIPRAKIN